MKKFNLNTVLFSTANQLYQELQILSEVLPVFDASSKLVDGRVILRDNFDKILSKYPEVLIFGEDTGTIGDVNQGLRRFTRKIW